VRIIIECPERILHLEAGHIHADCPFATSKPLAVRRRTIHFRQLRQVPAHLAARITSYLPTILAREGSCSGFLAVCVKPVEGVDDLNDLMAGVAAEAVGFARKAHESGLYSQELERRVVLLGFGHRSAEVFIAGHQQKWAS